MEKFLKKKKMNATTPDNLFNQYCSFHAEIQSLNLSQLTEHEKQIFYRKFEILQADTDQLLSQMPNTLAKTLAELKFNLLKYIIRPKF